MSTVDATIFLTMATGLNAETLSFPSFQIETPTGWERSVENSLGSDLGGAVTLRKADIAGTFRILSYGAPAVVNEDRLRNVTNVDAAAPLSWQEWGGYSGYQYDYLEKGSFYRQWWLVNERAVIFVTYQNDLESTDVDAAVIDAIVRSITVKKP